MIYQYSLKTPNLTTAIHQVASNELGHDGTEDTNGKNNGSPYPYLKTVLDTLGEEILNQKKPSKCTLYILLPGPTPSTLVENTIFKPDINLWNDVYERRQKDNKSTNVTKDIFKNVHFDGAYCSYAQRTYDTAKTALGDRQIAIKPRKKFCEMRVGPIAGKTDNEIKEFFNSETGYPGESTEITFPKLWAKRQGGPIKPEDLFLDHWRDDIDTFDDFSAKFIQRISNFAHKNLDKTFLIVPHNIHMKIIVAKAKEITTDRINCASDSYYKIEIDSNGNFFLQDDMMGITISG